MQRTYWAKFRGHVLIIKLKYPLPKCYTALPIPHNRILTHVKDAHTQLPLLVGYEVLALPALLRSHTSSVACSRSSAPSSTCHFSQLCHKSKNLEDRESRIIAVEGHFKEMFLAVPGAAYGEGSELLPVGDCSLGR